jgi:electron transport complex protein RnfD
VSSGASLGAVIAIFLGLTIPGMAHGGTMVLAMVFAFLSLVVILSLAYVLDRSLSTNSIILIGVIFSMFVNSVMSLLISFAGPMTRFPETVRTLFENPAVAGATPMTALKAGEATDWFQMLFNTHSGTIGEASAIAILLGLLYLLARKVVNIRIPAVYILSTVGFVALLQLVTGNTALLTVDFLVTHLCGGGLLIGACFMANDYATSPITPAGQVIYALILGLLTALFRCVGSAAEGVSYAIILGNLMVPIIERLTVPKPFGVKKRKA